MEKSGDPTRYELVEVVLLAEESASVDGQRVFRFGKYERARVPRHIAEVWCAEDQDGGPRAVFVEDVEWTLKSPPAEYLKSNPGGPQATMARVANAHPGLISSDSSEPSDDSSESADS